MEGSELHARLLAEVRPSLPFDPNDDHAPIRSQNAFWFGAGRSEPARGAVAAVPIPAARRPQARGAMGRRRALLGQPDRPGHAGKAQQERVPQDRALLPPPPGPFVVTRILDV